MAIKSVPAPPTPSFDVDAPLRVELQSRWNARPTKRFMTPLGIEFFGRVQTTSLWFGALIGIVAWTYSQSLQVLWSLALGFAVSLTMLKSQVWFVTALIRPRSDGRPNASKMLWIVQPLKYAILMALIAWALKSMQMNAPMFALGVFLTPFVILAKAIGRAISFEMRPIAEVYGTPASSTRSSEDGR